MSVTFLTYAIYRCILRTERKQLSYEEVDIIPRPRKCRKVCQLPRIQEFHPLGPPPCGPAVVLNVDEYEAIRLIDPATTAEELERIYYYGGFHGNEATDAAINEAIRREENE